MNGFVGFFRDKIGVWSIDKAGIEEGRFRARDIRSLLEEGAIGPHTWLRHFWSRKYSLVGETLYYNGFATEAEFCKWFPMANTLNTNT